MYKDVINFWFEEISPAHWWQKDLEFDLLIKKRFSHLHQQAVQGELNMWRAFPEGSLAEVIILDQFSRNIYRDKPQSFAQDGQALVLAQHAIAHKQDVALNPTMRKFLYMPFMHSESKKIHQQAVDLFEKLEEESALAFELKHKAIIDRFGRYPHRNAILNRTSSEAELAFLKEPNSSF